MISRETENVKSSEEIESAFRALSSEGKPYVTKEELYQVLPLALGRGVEIPLKSKAGGCPLGRSSRAESAVTDPVVHPPLLGTGVPPPPTNRPQSRPKVLISSQTRLRTRGVAWALTVWKSTHLSAWLVVA